MRLSLEQRERIVDLAEAGRSVREISTLTGVHRSSVQRCLTAWREAVEMGADPVQPAEVERDVLAGCAWPPPADKGSVWTGRQDRAGVEHRVRILMLWGEHVLLDEAGRSVWCRCCGSFIEVGLLARPGHGHGETPWGRVRPAWAPDVVVPSESTPIFGPPPARPQQVWPAPTMDYGDGVVVAVPRDEECSCCGEDLVAVDPTTREGWLPRCRWCFMDVHRHDHVMRGPVNAPEPESLVGAELRALGRGVW